MNKTTLYVIAILYILMHYIRIYKLIGKEKLINNIENWPVTKVKYMVKVMYVYIGLTIGLLVTSLCI